MSKLQDLKKRHNQEKRQLFQPFRVVENMFEDGEFEELYTGFEIKDSGIRLTKRVSIVMKD